MCLASWTSAFSPTKESKSLRPHCVGREPCDAGHGPHHHEGGTTGRDVGTKRPTSQACTPAPRSPTQLMSACTQWGPHGACPPPSQHPSPRLRAPGERPHSPARCPGGTGCPPSPSLGSAAGSGPGLPHSLRTGAGVRAPPTSHTRTRSGASRVRVETSHPSWPSRGTRPVPAPKPMVSLKTVLCGGAARQPQTPGPPEGVERSPCCGAGVPASLWLGQAPRAQEACHRCRKETYGYRWGGGVDKLGDWD